MEEFADISSYPAAIYSTRNTTDNKGGCGFLNFDFLGIQNLAKETKRRFLPKSKTNISGSPYQKKKNIRGS